jgi:hypothetical protein
MMAKYNQTWPGLSTWLVGYSGWCQRAAAAFLAISLRSAALSLAARALPPFAPPRRPRATAAGFFPSSGSGVVGSPTASPTIEAASRLRSAGRFLLGRSGMLSSKHTRPPAVNPRQPETDPLPAWEEAPPAGRAREPREYTRSRPHPTRVSQRARRPAKARATVTSSAYCTFEPAGSPWASRVTGTPAAASTSAR